MKNKTKQVVILDSFSSPYIMQAILILKDYNPALEDQVIQEAERVVNQYLNRKNLQKKKSFSALFPWILTAIFLAVGLSFFLLNR